MGLRQMLGSGKAKQKKNWGGGVETALKWIKNKVGLHLHNLSACILLICKTFDHVTKQANILEKACSYNLWYGRHNQC